jgi:hypothetical protein
MAKLSKTRLAAGQPQEKRARHSRRQSLPGMQVAERKEGLIVFSGRPLLNSGLKAEVTSVLIGAYSEGRNLSKGFLNFELH